MKYYSLNEMCRLSGKAWNTIKKMCINKRIKTEVPPGRITAMVTIDEAERFLNSILTPEAKNGLEEIKRERSVK